MWFRWMGAIFYNIIIQYQSLEMAESHIQAKIKQLLSLTSDPYSIRSLFSKDPYHLDISHYLPTLTPQQVRNICKAQEQSILENVLTTGPADLYEDMSRMCPQNRDIKHISHEEVATRLNLYSTKLILTERPTCESESQSEDWQESKGQTFFGEVHLDMRMIEEQNNKDHMMRNIFEEADNHHCWTVPEYFGLS